MEKGYRGIEKSASKLAMANEKHIHFIGICGVAMSALALAFKREGWHVTGSDVGFYPPISTYLDEQGISYYPGWHPEKMGKPDLVVVGNVAGSNNAEWQYVQEQKLNYKSYPEVIAENIIKKNSIVCAGTYGKTTSTALLTHILKNSDFDPSYMFGGLSQNKLPSAALTQSDWSVVEGDEYKTARWDLSPKFTHYSPTHLLLTSVVWDHADIYKTKKEYIEVFQKLYNSIPGYGLKIISTNAIVPIFGGASNNTEKQSPSALAALLATLTMDVLNEKKKPFISYGNGETGESNYMYKNIVQNKNGLKFEIWHEQKMYSITSPCLGEYMADNITACFALASELGIAKEKILTSIATFAGMKRRLEKRFEGKVTIFDDIAHSPTKAKSILHTLRKVYTGKILAVFEPNIGNRRPEAIPFYDNAFANADKIFIPRLTKLKTNPTETASLEGNDLANIIKGEIVHVENDEELVNKIYSEAKAGDVVVFLGSHGFRGMIENLVKKYENS
jgi:UDP-N-acetylmuramate: L-alanyl-gamma-D-glutamyl-meso-diaminopimelate ligase